MFEKTAQKKMYSGETQRIVQPFRRTSGFYQWRTAESSIPNFSDPEIRIAPAMDRSEQQANRMAEGLYGGPSLPNLVSGLEIFPSRQDPPGEKFRSSQTPALNPSSASGAQVQTTRLTEKLLLPGNEGQKLPDSVKGEMETHLDGNFDRVRIHLGGEANLLARSLNARAFTFGNNLFFASGEFSPHTREGKHLLAHELTHVMQQGAASRKAGSGFEAHRVAVIQRQVRTGHVHDRPAFEEQHVAFARYSAEKGWIFIEGPSGAGGHGLTEPGLDGVAYNIRTGELEIIEQKGISRVRKIGIKDKPTAVTKNFARNLDAVIKKVEGMKELPHRSDILSKLKNTRTAIEGKGKVPEKVRIVITSEKATGITRGLSGYWKKRGVELPVEFESTGLPASAAKAPTKVAGKVPPLETEAPVKVPRTKVKLETPALGPEARLAARAAESVASEVKWLRAVRLIGTMTEILNAVSAISDLLEFSAMAENALAGEGFMFTEQIKAARQLESYSRRLLKRYRESSVGFESMQVDFFRAAADPWAAGEAGLSLWDLYLDLRDLQEEIANKISEIRKAYNEVDAKAKASEMILESREASSAIAMATFGTAELARIFAAHEDFLTLRGILSTALKNFEELQKLLKTDTEYFYAWYEALTDVCERGGVCF